MDHDLYDDMYATEAPSQQDPVVASQPSTQSAEASEPAMDAAGWSNSPFIGTAPADTPTLTTNVPEFAQRQQQSTSLTPNNHDDRGAQIAGGAADRQYVSPEDCVMEIASALGLSGALPGQVLHAVRTVISEAQQLKEQLQQVKRENLALNIQVADRASDMLEMRQQLFAQEAAAEPAIVQLKSLLCDPAVVREYTSLKDEVVRLQKELQVAKDHLQAVNFNAEAKKGRLLMSKLKGLMHENELLGAKLKSVAKLEGQVAMVGEFAENLRENYSALQAHVTALDAEAEDLTGHIATLQKMHVGKDIKAFQFQRKYDSHHQDRGRQGDMSDRPPHMRPNRPDGRRFNADGPPQGRVFPERLDRGVRGPPADTRPYHREKRPYDGAPGPYNQRNDGGYGNREGGLRYPPRDFRRRQ